MAKAFIKKDWVRLIKQNLLECPYNKGESAHEFTPADNLVVTITTKTSRNYSFGGPIWCGIIDVSIDDYLQLSYLSPKKRPRKIKWNNIRSMEFIHNSP
jgi:hypothetical protein